MRESTKNISRGIQWKFTESLDDLGFADDIALLSQRHQEIKAKPDTMDALGKQIGPSFNGTKTKLTKINPRNEEPISINNTAIEEDDEFFWAARSLIMENQKRTEELPKPCGGAFATLRSIWKFTRIKRPTKLGIFNSNVLAVLLYGSESSLEGNSFLQQ